MDIKKLVSLLQSAFKEWNADKVQRLSAALSYYTVFSIAPLLIIIISLTGLFLGEKAAQGQVFNQTRQLLGDSGAKAVENVVQKSRKTSSSVVSTITGFIALLAGASSLFGQLQESLNDIWHTRPPKKKGIIDTLTYRFTSFGMVLVIGFILLVSLMLTSALTLINNYFQGLLPVHPAIFYALNILFSIAVITILFALMFKVLPDVKLTFQEVWKGALLTAVLFVLGQMILGIYLGKNSVASTYGAAGSLIIILLWVYYSSQIFFFGAEFTKVYVWEQHPSMRPQDEKSKLLANQHQNAKEIAKSFVDGFKRGMQGEKLKL
jgi:membrane protein